MRDPISIRVIRRQQAGRSLAVLLATLSALAAVWAVVWFNVPRDFARDPPPQAAPQGDLTSRVPPVMKQPVQPQSRPTSKPDKGAGADEPETAGAASAVEQEVTNQGTGIETALNCREEVRKLCGEVEPGSGRFRDCLGKHRDLMPVACQRNLEERVGQLADGARAILASCQGDLRRWCPNISLRGAPIIRCLREHANDLSGGCTEVLVQERVL